MADKSLAPYVDEPLDFWSIQIPRFFLSKSTIFAPSEDINTPFLSNVFKTSLTPFAHSASPLNESNSIFNKKLFLKNSSQFSKLKTIFKYLKYPKLIDKSIEFNKE